ncbi:MAG: HU family DNA-binding protein [Rikenellaceae bacterium]
MTKAQIVSQIAKSTGIEKALVMEVVESMMECVKDSLKGGENVYLRGFGSFILKTRAEKIARNISNNTSLVVPAHQIPAFKPAKEFANQVKETQKVK